MLRIIKTVGKKRNYNLTNTITDGWYSGKPKGRKTNSVHFYVNTFDGIFESRCGMIKVMITELGRLKKKDKLSSYEEGICCGNCQRLVKYNGKEKVVWNK